MSAPATTLPTPRRWSPTSTTSPPCSTASSPTATSIPPGSSAEDVRLRAPEPRQGAPAGHRRAALPGDRLDARRAARRRTRCRCPATSAADARGDRRRGGDTARRAARPRRRPAPPDRRPRCESLARRRAAARCRRPRRSSTPCSRAGDGLDLVGIYAGGPVCRGFANSLGQRNWHEATTFNLEWSLYHRADKAVKSRARRASPGTPRAFAAKMARGARAARAHRPAARSRSRRARYRAYLAPAAMEEIVGLLCWGGFSARALATRQSPLVADAARRRRALDPRVYIAEATADGVAPGIPGARASRVRRACR